MKRPLGGPLLLPSFFTLAGPIPFRMRAEAAGRAGYRGIGVGHDDLRHTLGALSHADVRAVLADNGLEWFEIEFIGDFLSTQADNPAACEVRRFILDAARDLGAAHVKAGTSGPDAPLDLMIERFAALCEEAASAGCNIALEISPIGRIADLPTAVALVAGAGQANGGLLVDIWHMTRMGVTNDEIAALPRALIAHVELSDGAPEQVGDYLDDTIMRRRLCGDGLFETAGFLAALAATGYDGPYGVEILSDEMRATHVADAARVTHDTALAQFSASPSRPRHGEGQTAKPSGWGILDEALPRAFP
jgi:sugar phosphate isomerase/epimerase